MQRLFSGDKIKFVVAYLFCRTLPPTEQKPLDSHCIFSILFLFPPSFPPAPSPPKKLLEPLLIHSFVLFYTSICIHKKRGIPRWFLNGNGGRALNGSYSVSDADDPQQLPPFILYTNTKTLRYYVNVKVKDFEMCTSVHRVSVITPSREKKNDFRHKSWLVGGRCGWGSVILLSQLDFPYIVLL